MGSRGAYRVVVIGLADLHQPLAGHRNHLVERSYLSNRILCSPGSIDDPTSSQESILWSVTLAIYRKTHPRASYAPARTSKDTLRPAEVSFPTPFEGTSCFLPAKASIFSSPDLDCSEAVNPRMLKNLIEMWSCKDVYQGNVRQPRV